MGIIARQGSKSSLLHVGGVFVAAISTLYIYPKFTEVYGFSQFLLTSALLLFPFMGLGSSGALIKFFPKFRTEDNANHGLLLYALTPFLFIFLFSGIIFGVWGEPIIGYLKQEWPSSYTHLYDYYLIILILAATLVIVYNLYYYISNYGRIVVPNLFVQFGYKVFLPLLIIATAQNYSLQSIGVLIICFYVMVIASLLLYMKKLGIFNLTLPDRRFITRSIGKEVRKYSLFSSLNHLGSLIVFRIDGFMISIILGFTANGIYSIMLFISGIIDIPAKSINTISSPLISQHWKNNELEKINTIYQKSATTITIASVAIVIMIWFGIDFVASISADPEKFFIGKTALVFLMVCRLIDGITSINDQIIVFSDKYKYNLVFIVFLGVINIVLNLVFISSWGLTGAAFATCVSILFYNVIKLVFIYWQFKMIPFSKNLLFVLILGACAFSTLYLLTAYLNSFYLFVIAGLVIVCIYIPLIFVCKISEEFNKLILTYLKLFRPSS